MSHQLTIGDRIDVLESIIADKQNEMKQHQAEWGSAEADCVHYFHEKKMHAYADAHARKERADEKIRRLEDEIADHEEELSALKFSQEIAS